MVLNDENINRIMTEVASRFLIPKFLELGMNASGEWVDSIETTAANNVGKIRGRDYSEFLQNGRKPGKMPPIAPIERWVQVKLGLSGNEAKGAAFAIAKKIAAEGTEYHKQGGTDLLDVLDSPECLEYVRGELTTLFTVQAREEIQKFVYQEF